MTPRPAASMSHPDRWIAFLRIVVGLYFAKAVYNDDELVGHYRRIADGPADGAPDRAAQPGADQGAGNSSVAFAARSN